jgi:hypothetical protein
LEGERERAPARENERERKITRERVSQNGGDGASVPGREESGRK